MFGKGYPLMAIGRNLELQRYVHTVRSSLENHTRFQTKMGEVYTRFPTKTAQKSYPMGVPTYIAYIRACPPGRPRPRRRRGRFYVFVLQTEISLQLTESETTVENFLSAVYFAISISDPWFQELTPFHLLTWVNLTSCRRCTTSGDI